MAEDALKPYQFKPGHSGNPGGRPASRKARAALAKFKPEALTKLGEAISNGEPWAITLWCHYRWGKPVDSVQLSGKDGEALTVSVVINRTLTPDGQG